MAKWTWVSPPAGGVPSGISGISQVPCKLTGTNGDQIYEGSVTANFGVNGLAGTLDLNGRSETTSLFNGSATGVVTNSAYGTSSVWTVGATNATSNYAGFIQDGLGVVSLVKTGTGIQTLLWHQFILGGTTVNAGTLTARKCERLRFRAGHRQRRHPGPRLDKHRAARDHPQRAARLPARHTLAR